MSGVITVEQQHDARGVEPEFVLVLSCPDRIGIVHAVSAFLVLTRCSIVESQQYGDEITGQFFLRVQFRAENPATNADELTEGFAATAAAFGMRWQLWPAARPVPILVMTSRLDHCLNHLLFETRSTSMPVEVRAIVSNHPDHAELAAWHGVDFHHIPVDADNKSAAEQQLLGLVARYDIELVVLARYMQVLSDSLCGELGGKVINIHHSFLPSFKGAKPYAQAHQRGVKLIGATAHYVTADLDEGPIIEQDVVRVNHGTDEGRLVEIGRSVEAAVLTRAVRWHAEHRVLLNGNRSVVFS
jgi:formyltetrahydrofolate deformylase